MKKKLATKKRLFAPCSHCVNECTHQPIQVLIVKPYFRPYGATICPKLHSMQDIVGGCIQVVHDGLLNDDAVIVCNEEGKLVGLRQTALCATAEVKCRMSYAVRLWSSALPRGFYKPDPAAVCRLEGQVFISRKVYIFQWQNRRSTCRRRKRGSGG